MYNGFELIKKANVIFWDFDGVIKDSLEVKSDAFEMLFESFGTDISKKIRKHHEDNGGMSRFDKLPIYLEWSGQSQSQELVDEYSDRFSSMVKMKVIASKWVPGVLEYIERNSGNQIFFLITATPQPEIEEIADKLDILQYFKVIFGSPTKKEHAINNVLEEYSITPDKAVMIGDSKSDYDAALVNHVPFVLRKTILNKLLQETYTCPMISDFIHE